MAATPSNPEGYEYHGIQAGEFVRGLRRPEDARAYMEEGFLWPLANTAGPPT
jgi:hypothetical protein